MTTFEALSVATALMSLLIVGVSVWILKTQTNNLQKAFEDQTESSTDVLLVAVTQAYLDHPSLRPVFNEREAGKTPQHLDDDTRFRASAMAELLADAMDRILRVGELRGPHLAGDNDRLDQGLVPIKRIPSSVASGASDLV